VRRSRTASLASQCDCAIDATRRALLRELSVAGVARHNSQIGQAARANAFGKYNLLEKD
jgi:hypothetical protein